MGKKYRRNLKGERCGYCGEVLFNEKDKKLKYHCGVYACICKKNNIVIESELGFSKRLKKRRD